MNRQKKKRKQRPEPAFKAWIVGHEVEQEDPLRVELIEAGGPVHVATALAYLHQHFPDKRWNFGRGLDFVASEIVPRQEPLDVGALARRARELGGLLGAALDGLDDRLREVEQELLTRWPDQTSTVELEVWEGLTQRLTWDGKLYIDTSQEGRDPCRAHLLTASRRLRVLAVEALVQLDEQLRCIDPA